MSFPLEFTLDVEGVEEVCRALKETIEDVERVKIAFSKIKVNVK